MAKFAALLFCLCAACAGAAEAPLEPVNPYPRATLGTTKAAAWTFKDGPAGWVADHDCTIGAADGVLKITSTGDDPYLHAPAGAPGGRMELRLAVRSRAAGEGRLFWSTAEAPGWSEERAESFPLNHDGQWQTSAVTFEVKGTLKGLRLDPGTAPGVIEIRSIELLGVGQHPLEIIAAESGEKQVRVRVKNHGAEPREFSVCGKAAKAGGGETVEVTVPLAGAAAFEAVPLRVTAAGLPDVVRPVFIWRPDGKADWVVRESEGLRLCVARDGSGARLERGGAVAAVLAPIIHSGGAVPKMELREYGSVLKFQGEGLMVALALERGELQVSIQSDRPCEGPVLRAIGTMEQALFAGLEYLEKGEQSSSSADIETADRFRYAPDPLKVTLPLMACVTDRGTAAMVWKDTALQPVFAVPNFFDGAADSRMALRGRAIDATVLVRGAAPIEDAILWAVRKQGLPPLPKAPRSRADEFALCLKGLSGPLRNDIGWGHCVEPSWARQPFADQASTVWRLTGAPPDLSRLVSGGAHIRDDAIYFVTGRAEEWLRIHADRASRTIAEQKPDGSFRYQGKYQRGHWEDTASGHCAARAMQLLEFAYMTGDQAALDAGCRTLDYMKRFRTPRGAQVWELSLHTPDILAAAYLVWAYVRGYELTGRQDYLERARAWAVSGVPFVYLWGRYPVMTYSTIAVYGATNWRAPLWIGLPVQWCGLVYAYSLALLAPHDKTLDWRQLAEGILIAGEQMQSASGGTLGCFPDSWDLAGQSGRGPWINPCPFVNLRLALEGEADSLAVARDGRHRVVAPMPVTIRGGEAHIQARRGLKYQVLIDGKRVVAVDSKGTDVVPLAAPPATPPQQ